jgi:hypothetical protein
MGAPTIPTGSFSPTKTHILFEFGPAITIVSGQIPLAVGTCRLRRLRIINPTAAPIQIHVFDGGANRWKHWRMHDFATRSGEVLGEIDLEVEGW